MASESAPPPGGPGPTLAALDALWARYRSRWRRLLSRGAIAELQLRASFDPELLDVADIARRIPPGTVPDCPRCDDLCCAGLENVVSLRLKDLAVLIDLGRTDLISKKKPVFPPSMLRRRPQLEALMRSSLYRTLPVLRQRGEQRICAALTVDLTCSIHPHWPTSCQRFPYTLSAVRREVHWGTRCPSKQSGPEHEAHAQALFAGAVAAYNERVRDAVLLAHAPRALEAMGLAHYLTGPDEDPFEDAPRSRLPLLEE
jgi:hypothetical protein